MDNLFDRTEVTERTVSGKRLAPPITDYTDPRCKRANVLKDSLGPPHHSPSPETLSTRAPQRLKRPLDEGYCVTVHEVPVVGAIAAAADPSSRRTQGSDSDADGDALRELHASDLENSLTSLTAALRWRSPAKPHKLPRLHGPHRPPGLPTAVRGIVDLTADCPEDEDEDEEQPQQPQQPPSTTAAAPQQRHPSLQSYFIGFGPATTDCQQHRNQQLPCGGALGSTWPSFLASGAQVRSAAGQPQQPHPEVPAPPQPPQQEWGHLFRSLSLDGSLRSDPVYAAMGSNRAAGSGGGGRRGVLPGTSAHPQEHEGAQPVAEAPQPPAAAATTTTINSTFAATPREVLPAPSAAAGPSDSSGPSGRGCLALTPPADEFGETPSRRVSAGAATGLVVGALFGAGCVFGGAEGDDVMDAMEVGEQQPTPAATTGAAYSLVGGITCGTPTALSPAMSVSLHRLPHPSGSSCGVLHGAGGGGGVRPQPLQSCAVWPLAGSSPGLGTSSVAAGVYRNHPARRESSGGGFLAQEAGRLMAGAWMERM